MRLSPIGMAGFLRAASVFIIMGLVAEVVSLVWFHPLAFVLFVFIAVSLVGLGMLVYLFSLVFVASAPAAPAGDRRDPPAG
jgi:hypothetical protein